jgi:hypothetical protein
VPLQTSTLPLKVSGPLSQAAVTNLLLPTQQSNSRKPSSALHLPLPLLVCPAVFRLLQLVAPRQPPRGAAPVRPPGALPESGQIDAGQGGGGCRRCQVSSGAGAALVLASWLCASPERRGDFFWWRPARMTRTPALAPSTLLAGSLAPACLQKCWGQRCCLKQGLLVMALIAGTWL